MIGGKEHKREKQHKKQTHNQRNSFVIAPSCQRISIDVACTESSWGGITCNNLYTFLTSHTANHVHCDTNGHTCMCSHKLTTCTVLFFVWLAAADAVGSGVAVIVSAVLGAICFVLAVIVIIISVRRCKCGRKHEAALPPVQQNNGSGIRNMYAHGSGAAVTNPVFAVEGPVGGNLTSVMHEPEYEMIDDDGNARAPCSAVPVHAWQASHYDTGDSSARDETHVSKTATATAAAPMTMAACEARGSEGARGARDVLPLHTWSTGTYDHEEA